MTTQALQRLAPIEFVQIPRPRVSPRYQRFTDQELREIFTDSSGPLVEPFPRSPEKWPAREVALQLIRLRDVMRDGFRYGFQFPADAHLRVRQLEQRYAEVAARRLVPRQQSLEFPEWVQ
jgi:hypothetical protein